MTPNFRKCIILSNIIDTLDIATNESILCDTWCETDPSMKQSNRLRIFCNFRKERHSNRNQKSG